MPPSSADTAVATALTASTDGAGFPNDSQWQAAIPIRFDTDWQGNHSDPQRATEIRLLWTAGTLFLRFVAHYRTITVFSDADAHGRRHQLWDRDVVEVFLQHDPREPNRYREFEVSPNGFWLDLDINNRALADLKSGLQRRAKIDEASRIWTAELAIPVTAITHDFDPQATWRVNFYRVEGPSEPRFYSSWQPTRTPQPDFHVPDRFGYLKFAPPTR